MNITRDRRRDKHAAFVFSAHARAATPGHASSVEHHHAGGPRAHSTRPHSEHATTASPAAHAAPAGPPPYASPQTQQPAPSPSPSPSRCSDATIPDSPIPIHTGCGPPGVRRTSAPPGSACAPANAPHSHADTAPTRITIDRRCTATTLRTDQPTRDRCYPPAYRNTACPARSGTPLPKRSDIHLDIEEVPAPIAVEIRRRVLRREERQKR